MTPQDRLFLHKVFDFFLTFIIFLLMASLLVHEAGHDLAATLLGYKVAWIDLDWATLSGTHDIEGAPYAGTFDAIVWSIGGGLFAAVVMGLLWWRAWASPCHWDLDDEAALGIQALGQLTYGAGEALPFTWASYLYFPGLALGLIIYLPRLIDWWRSA